ncbi:MAG: hypothetical protein RMJ81_05450 [Candidatus Kryptonium sp.]|nr:hypothetical protein [Candidatus Kryptonium sp.]MCX7762842.1 hypothetical protein [Candidatus Kryptonium sp.]MDW8109086.1 hypothetical protein [Candidatus Kryptonium sp.]
METVYHLGIAWEWEYDFDFVNLIESKCKEKGISVCLISPENLKDIYNRVKSGDIKFLSYFDRASDTNENFLELNVLVERSGSRSINRYEDMIRALDKAKMHLELLNIGVNLPFTFILPPLDYDPELKLGEKEIEKIGTPFVIKPSTETGGGFGVKIGYSIQDIIEARKEIPYDSYLVQELIKPIYLGDKKAWFRAFYVLEEVLICWWDNEDKIYEIVEPNELVKWGLEEIKNIMFKIHKVCNLDFFSSEIALIIKDGDKKFVVVDYVNEIPDMRLKSKAIDGVPDEIVERISDRIAKFVANLK